MTATSSILTSKVRLGLLLVVLVAFLSFLAVISLLFYICYKSLRTPPQGVEKWKFIRSHVDYYFLSLLISDLIMAWGSVMSAAWVITSNDTVPRGAYCTAQGAIKQIGNVGTALATLVIAVNTFSVLVLRWHPSGDEWRIPLAVISIIWLFLLCISSIPGSTLDHYYGPSVYWCWIEARWYGQRLGLEYALYWLTAVVNICLYVPLFLCLRGNLKVGKDISSESMGKFRVKWQWLPSNNANQAGTHSGESKLHRKVAKQMLAYPIAYLFLITPISVTRWMDFSGDSVPYQATCFAAAVFSASGLVNTTLYLITRGIRSEGEQRDDSGGRSYGMGMVTEGNLNEEPSVGTASGGPLRRTRKDHVASQATFTTTDSAYFSGGLSPAAFLSPGGSRTHSSSSPLPDDRV
ncbi:hypothetical protein FRB99_000800 [Tulasnella sp. 403]|nr:hypothetical protein FRB99_000800 [Tulasnella sp. 403]